MEFICGVVDRDGCRRIFSAESKPTLENIDDLGTQTPFMFYEWGPAASVEGSVRTAKAILSSVTNREEVFVHARRYAEDVVRGRLGTDRMWILPVSEVELWLTENRKVA